MLSQQFAILHIFIRKVTPAVLLGSFVGGKEDG
jgi:hypothetical protein